MNGYLVAMSNYATFRGRASRREFWGYGLTLVLLFIPVLIIDEMIFGMSNEGVHPLAGVFSLAHLIPSIAVTARRLHDIDRSGWWMLLSLTGIGSLVVLVMNVLGGTEGPNRFGPDPKDVRSNERFKASQPHQRETPSLDSDHIGGRKDALSEPYFGPQPSGPTGSVIADLERLAQLKATGAISEAEFEVMKARSITGKHA